MLCELIRPKLTELFPDASGVMSTSVHPSAACCDEAVTVEDMTGAFCQVIAFPPQLVFVTARTWYVVAAELVESLSRLRDGLGQSVEIEPEVGPQLLAALAGHPEIGGGAVLALGAAWLTYASATATKAAVAALTGGAGTCVRAKAERPRSTRP